MIPNNSNPRLHQHLQHQNQYQQIQQQPLPRATFSSSVPVSYPSPQLYNVSGGYQSTAPVSPGYISGHKSQLFAPMQIPTSSNIVLPNPLQHISKTTSPSISDSRDHSQHSNSKENFKSVSSPVYNTTVSGEQYPIDLEPYLSRGIPLKISQGCNDVNSDLFAARFPDGLDLKNLSEPISFKRDMAEFEFDDNGQHSLSKDESFSRPNVFRRNDISPKKFESDHLSWRLIDSCQKHLVGRHLDIDTSTYFIMINKGSHMELLPLDSWYAFQSDVAPTQHGTSSADIAERKRRAAIRQEEIAEADMLNRRGSHLNIDHDRDSSPVIKKNKRLHDEMKDLYAEDAGLQRQQKKRLKQFIKSKRKNIRREDEDVGDSALNIGQVKRAEVDWDYDDDGKATDDEDDVGNVDDLLEAIENQKNEYHESDNDDEEVLTKYGQQVHSALESQKEQDAEDELAQFSDNDDDEQEEELEKQANIVSDGRSNLTIPINSGTVDDYGTLTTTSKLKIESKSKNSPAGSSSGVKKSGDERLTAEVVRQRVIRTLSLQGGRMPTKQFIQSFNITSNKSDLFKLIRKTIYDICEVHTEQQNGVPVKILELQSQFR